VHDHVDVTVRAIVRVAAVVDDRRGRETRAAEEDATGVRGAPRGGRIGAVPLGHVVQVRIEAADARVEREELLLGDPAVVQHREAVLDAVVVQRAAGEPRRGVHAVDVGRMVVDRRARSVRVGFAVA
jgi:hypothetical protein